MKVHVEMKSYDILRNNHCLNRWVKYFYGCELFKKSLPSHKLDPRKQRYDLTDPNDQIKIDGVLLGAGYVLTQDYIEETYGVEVESMPGATQEVKNPDNTKKH